MAGRQSLQDFQARLARRLADPGAEAPTADWLGIAWRGVHALLPLAQAGEVFTPTALQPVPHTQAWVTGVAALRGGLCLVLDWVALLGLAAGTAGQGADDDEAAVHWVSLNPVAGVPAALCADRLLGLRNRADFQPEPGLNTAVGSDPDTADAIRVWSDRAGQRWHEIDLLRLARSPAFLNPYRPGHSARAA